jgi:hypothetical protein
MEDYKTEYWIRCKVCSYQKRLDLETEGAVGREGRLPNFRRASIRAP